MTALYPARPDEAIESTTTEGETSSGALLEMALTAEQSAQSFYTALAGKFKTYEKTFLRLAEDEARHAATYSELLRTEGRVATSEDKEIAESRIRALVGMGIMDALKGPDVSEVEDLRAAVELALKLEQNTLLFYQNLLLYFANGYQDQIHKIVDVEYDHMLQLSRIDYFE